MVFDNSDKIFRGEFSAMKLEPASGIVENTSNNVYDIFSNGKMFDKSMLIGYRLFDEGNYEEALLHFKKAYELFPENSMTILQIGITLILLGKDDESLKYLNLITKCQYKSEVFYYISLCYRNKQEFLKAFESINISLNLKPLDYEFLLLKGIILIDLGKYKEALLFFDKVKKINPECGDIDYYIGVCYNSLQMYE